MKLYTELRWVDELNIEEMSKAGYEVQVAYIAQIIGHVW